MKNLTKKLSYAIYIVLATVLFASCSNPTEKEFYDSVREIYPNADIYTKKEGSIMRFIVIKDSNIFEVNTMNITNTEVTKITRLHAQ